MYLIAGLGNPGNKYTYTRHNAGFMALSDLAQLVNAPQPKTQFDGLVSIVSYKGERLILCEPLTYMNLSGDCIAPLARYYKVPLENIIIMYDDFDIPLGEIRIRKKGGPGTQNGMKSIVYSLDSTDFPRIRIGTGPVPEGESKIDFVLSPFEGQEKEEIEKSTMRAAKAALMIVTDGIDQAMNEFHRHN